LCVRRSGAHILAPPKIKSLSLLGRERFASGAVSQPTGACNHHQFHPFVPRTQTPSSKHQLFFSPNLLRSIIQIPLGYVRAGSTAIFTCYNFHRYTRLSFFCNITFSRTSAPTALAAPHDSNVALLLPYFYFLVNMYQSIKSVVCFMGLSRYREGIRAWDYHFNGSGCGRKPGIRDIFFFWDEPFVEAWHI